MQASVKILKNSTHLNTEDLLALFSAVMDTHLQYTPNDVEIEVHYVTGQYLRSSPLVATPYEWESSMVLHVLPPDRWDDSPLKMLTAGLTCHAPEAVVQRLAKAFYAMLVSRGVECDFAPVSELPQVPVRLNDRQGMTVLEIRAVRKLMKAERVQFYIGKRLTKTLKGLKWMVPYAKRCLTRIESANQIMSEAGRTEWTGESPVAMQDLEDLVALMKSTKVIRRPS